MGKKVADGPSPRNARVKIEYTPGKPKISFSYPTKNGVVGSMFGTIQMYWMMIYAIILITLLLLAPLIDTSFELIPKVDTYNPSYLKNFTTCSLQYPIEVQNNFSYVVDHLCRSPKQEPINVNILWSILILFLGLQIPPYIIYYPFHKQWDHLYPAYRAWKAEKKLAVYKSEDVKKNLYELDKKHPYFVELPVFENIVLDFKADGDFSKHLKEVEIREHKFKYWKPRLLKNKKPRLSVNEWVWYARFYFDKKPKTGDLKVLFC